MEHIEADVKTADTASLLARFLLWLEKQSLPRLIGLIFGNTRDLEVRNQHLLQLNKDLQSQVDKWQNLYISFQDSQLIAKGRIPTSPEAKQTARQAPNLTTSVNAFSRMEVAQQVDRLKETLEYHPEDLASAVNDLLVSNRPVDRETLRQFYLYTENRPVEDPGIIITQ